MVVLLLIFFRKDKNVHTMLGFNYVDNEIDTYAAA